MTLMQLVTFAVDFLFYFSFAGEGQGILGVGLGARERCALGKLFLFRYRSYCFALIK